MSRKDDFSSNSEHQGEDHEEEEDSSEHESQDDGQKTVIQRETHKDLEKVTSHVEEQELDMSRISSVSML
jgi:hypothetical protein